MSRVCTDCSPLSLSILGPLSVSFPPSHRISTSRPVSLAPRGGTIHRRAPLVRVAGVARVRPVRAPRPFSLSSTGVRIWRVRAAIKGLSLSLCVCVSAHPILLCVRVRHWTAVRAKKRAGRRRCTFACSMHTRACRRCSLLARCLLAACCCCAALSSSLFSLLCSYKASLAAAIQQTSSSSCIRVRRSSIRAVWW